MESEQPIMEVTTAEEPLCDPMTEECGEMMEAEAAGVSIVPYIIVMLLQGISI